MSYSKKIKENIKKKTTNNYNEIVKILEQFPDIPAKKKILESAKDAKKQLDSVVDENLKD
ncbi:MAG: hypothetical protein ACRD8Z_27895 [Nitrososphaeraceae archaeon]|jgi:hypothetical protein